MRVLCTFPGKYGDLLLDITRLLRIVSAGARSIPEMSELWTGIYQLAGPFTTPRLLQPSMPRIGTAPLFLTTLSNVRYPVQGRQAGSPCAVRHALFQAVPHA